MDSDTINITSENNAWAWDCGLPIDRLLNPPNRTEKIQTQVPNDSPISVPPMSIPYIISDTKGFLSRMRQFYINFREYFTCTLLIILGFGMLMQRVSETTCIKITPTCPRETVACYGIQTPVCQHYGCGGCLSFPHGTCQIPESCLNVTYITWSKFFEMENLFILTFLIHLANILYNTYTKQTTSPFNPTVCVYQAGQSGQSGQAGQSGQSDQTNTNKPLPQTQQPNDIFETCPECVEEQKNTSKTLLNVNTDDYIENLRALFTAKLESKDIDEALAQEIRGPQNLHQSESIIKPMGVSVKILPVRKSQIIKRDTIPDKIESKIMDEMRDKFYPSATNVEQKKSTKTPLENTTTKLTHEEVLKTKFLETENEDMNKYGVVVFSEDPFVEYEENHDH